jgi:hypothetical protein
MYLRGVIDETRLVLPHVVRWCPAERAVERLLRRPVDPDVDDAYALAIAGMGLPSLRHCLEGLPSSEAVQRARSLLDDLAQDGN